MFAITACSEGFKTTEAEIDPIGDTTTDTGDAIDTGEADTDNPDECAEGPSSGSVSMDSNCTYIPEASGNPFQSRVEWSMAHSMTDADGNFFSSYVFSDEPEMKSVFQSPAIGQATDDDGNGSVASRQWSRAMAKASRGGNDMTRTTACYATAKRPSMTTTTMHEDNG